MAHIEISSDEPSTEYRITLESEGLDTMSKLCSACREFFGTNGTTTLDGTESTNMNTQYVLEVIHVVEESTLYEFNELIRWILFCATIDYQ